MHTIKRGRGTRPNFSNNLRALKSIERRCWTIPTGPLTILRSQYQEIGRLYVYQKRRTADLEAPKL